MILKYLLTSICLLFAICANAQFYYSSDAINESLCHSSISRSDISSAFTNQAGLANCKTSFLASYQNRFGISEISQKSVAAAYHLKNSTIAASLNYFGFDLYNEKKVGLAYAMNLAKKVSMAVQLDYFGLKVKESTQENLNAFAGEIGVIYSPIENLKIATHVSNLSNQQYKNEENLPTIFTFGVDYQVGNKANFLFTLEKNTSVDNVIPHFGIECEALKNFFLRFGSSIKPNIISLGAGYRFKGFGIDFAFQKVDVLGWISSASLSYALK